MVVVSSLKSGANVFCLKTQLRQPMLSWFRSSQKEIAPPAEPEPVYIVESADPPASPPPEENERLPVGLLDSVPLSTFYPNVQTLGELRKYIENATTGFKFSEPFDGTNYAALQGELRVALTAAQDQPSPFSLPITVKMIASVFRKFQQASSWHTKALSWQELCWHLTRPWHFPIFRRVPAFQHVFQSRMRELRELPTDGTANSLHRSLFVEFCARTQVIIETKLRPF